MRSGLRVRRATIDDAEAIAAVNLRAGRAGWSGFVDREALAAIEPPVERWRERIAAARPPSAVLVAVEAARLVGFASLGAVEGSGSGELTALYTDPAVWGRGVGRRLMAEALEHLRHVGLRDAVLWTEERNARPRRIYERAGWRPDGGVREREFLGRTIRELRYRIDLDVQTRAETGTRDRP